MLFGKKLIFLAIKIFEISVGETTFEDNCLGFGFSASTTSKMNFDSKDVSKGRKKEKGMFF